VIHEFLGRFAEVAQSDTRHIENLLFLNEVRDLISHGDISYHRENILYVPKDEKRRKKFDERTQPTRSELDDGTRVLNLCAPGHYDGIATILADWEKIIETVARAYGVEPERIK